MKVIHWMPLNHDGESIIGGHKTQITNTVQGLKAIGVDARAEYGLNPQLPKKSIVHIYGGDESSILKLKLAGVKIVVSPIYWPEYINDTYANGFHRLFVKCKSYLSVTKRLLTKRTYPELSCFSLGLKYAGMSRMYSMADLIVPNSTLENDAIKNDLGIVTSTFVVPLGVDRTVFYNTSRSRSDDLIAYVGRVEPHKNQLKLVKAMQGQHYRLVLAGQLHPHHLDYCNRVLRYCTDNVSYAGHGDVEFVRNLYNQATIHILPSWSETVGLTSLEASACGCKIIHTKNGFGREYFGETAEYCDPASTLSIRKSIQSTGASDSVLVAQARRLTEYTWENTALSLLNAYNTLQDLD
jgi:glycosyltransferase involved in cell wall biosynthesis